MIFGRIYFQVDETEPIKKFSVVILRLFMSSLSVGQHS